MTTKLRNCFAAWILACALLAGSGLISLTEPVSRTASVDQLVREVESSYRGVKTLRANFTQTYTWGARNRVESGTVYFARGGLMRWDYTEPFEKLFLSDGRKLYLYIPAEKQLTRSTLKTSGDVRVPFLLMLSRPNLRKLFSKIELADQEPKRESVDFVLRAFPKRANEEGYDEALIEFDPPLNIRRLVIISREQGRMEFTFDHIQRNAVLAPGLFQFTAPAGTEVIDQR